MASVVNTARGGYVMLAPMVDKPVPTRCRYCGGAVDLVSAALVQPNGRKDNHLYMCVSCGASVGTHTGTAVPMGLLSNRRHRRQKQRVHNMFDATWRSGRLTRSEAYAALADGLGLSPEDCHIGWMDETTLSRAEGLVSNPYWYKTIKA